MSKLRSAQKLKIGLLFSIAMVATAPIAAERPWTRAAAAPQAIPCASLTTAALTGARITSATSIAASSSGAVTVAHCRVSGVIDTETKFTALLPDQWNERLFAGGGGGFVGSVQNQAQSSVNMGYATVGTDTGHQGAAGSASWALDNRERQINFGYVAIHRMTEVTKAIIKAHYGVEPKHSYFYGCSNGGRQALMEAQRYPNDFDGIVSCAPAYDFTNIATSFIHHAQVLFPDPRRLDASVVSPDNLKLLEAKVLEACDALDGVKDGVLDDPRDCHFKVADLAACPGDHAGVSCVTTAQRAAIAAIYAPTMSQGTLVYPGQPFGGEGQADGWPGWIAGADPQMLASAQTPNLQFAFGTEFFKYFVMGKSDWDYGSYDLSKWRVDTVRAADLNADSVDLAAFTARGGKLILAHGWADPALNPLSTVAYYERVVAHDASAGKSVRLFMMPGVLHCNGGAGPDHVDWFTPIADWVERGVAPARVIATKLDAGRVVNARPLCPYPQHAVYDGKGSITAAASFACRAR